VKFIRSKDEAIIVEGYMDLVSLFQSGIQNVAATLGTALTESHARALKKITQNVVVLFDGDQAGQEAAKRSLPILLAAGLRPRGLILPNELDPDEFVKQEGADSLLELVKNSKDLFNLVLSHWLIGYTGQVSQKLKLIDLLAPIFQQIPDANTKSLYLQEVAVALAVEKTWITNALKNMSEGRKPQENQDLGAKNVPAVSQINTVKTSGFVDPIKEKRPMQYKYQLKTIPKAELTLIKLVLSNSEYFNEAFQEGVERFLQDSTSKEIFSRALEVSRQTPEKFDTLVSLLTTYLDPTDTLVPDGTSGTGESEQKLLRDCIVKVKDDFLSKELKSLSLEVAANPHPEKLEKILQLKKEKLALRQ
jgi:DNA primase